MELLYIAILTVIAGGVGTLTGFGTSTIMVPILLLFFPFAPTLLLVGIIHWFGNVWKITLFREGVNWSLILLFGLPGIILAFFGAKLVFLIPEIFLSKILGTFLILYVLFLFFNPSFKFKQGVFVITTAGMLSGFFAGIFGIGGIIRGAFLSAFNLPKKRYIATVGVIGLAVDIVRIGTYIAEGAKLPSYLYWGLLLFIPASFLGAYFAKNIVDKISQDHFRIVISVFLFLIGIKLLVF